MYCSNCGYKLSEAKQEKAKREVANRTADSIMTYVCPRCGKIIKEGLNDEEVKALARASHTEIHKSRNTINTGMCFAVISTILIIVAYMFFLMSFKANAGGMLVTNCTEFYVSMILFGLSGCMYVYAFLSLFFGIKKNKEYKKLLKDIQNDVFVQ